MNIPDTMMKMIEDSFMEGWTGASEEFGKVVDAFFLWYWGETGTNLQDSFKQFAANYKHPKQ